MITAGIDLGAKSTKVAIVKDGEVIGKSLISTGFDLNQTAEEALESALEAAGVSKDQLEAIVTTGAGRKGTTFSTKIVSEVGAATKGAHHLNNAIRTVIEIGAEEGRAIKCDENGKALDFSLNEKCAAGAGSFVESMARALETTVDEIANLSLKATQQVPMNAQCVIFAESEVVSLIHQQIPLADIARAIHDAISGRISSMVRTVGLEEKVGVVGGVALNIGFLETLKEDLGVKELIVPEDCQYAGAIGAALMADK